MCDEILLNLEKQKVLLSEYGNHNGDGSLCDSLEYWEDRENGALFDDEKVSIIADYSQMVFEKTGRWNEKNSYTLRHSVEEYGQEREDIDWYVPNGLFIMAMIKSGFEYKFESLTSKKAQVAAVFKCKLVREYPLHQRRRKIVSNAN